MIEPGERAAEGADALLARRVTLLAAALAFCLSAAAPALYWWAARERLHAGMTTEARLIAATVSEEVRRNPDLWRFQSARFAGLLAVPFGGTEGTTERRRVITGDGTLIAEDPGDVGRFATLVREPFHDMGQPVGTIEIARPLGPIIRDTIRVAFGADAAGLLAFLLLRSVPLRLLRRAVERASHLAAHDALTGLANRTRLHEELGRLLIQARAGAVGSPAVLMLDLDRFKPVNDMHGDAAGDRLLQEVASRITACAREGDVVTRLGGDEFVLAVVTGRTGHDGIARLAQRLVAALEAPIDLGHGVIVQVGCSVGVAVADDLAVKAETLLAQADTAMYRAKADGRGRFRFFEPGMDTRQRERTALEGELRLALLRDELVPHYQPLVELGTNRLVGFEMLARWPHPKRGMVPPLEFVSIAEDAGLIGLLTERLLRRACATAAGWPADIMLAVNVSPLQLRDRGLPDVIRAALLTSGLRPERLEIELTESALLADFALARTILDELKEIGVRLSLDDFGTGYSSLRHLQGKRSSAALLAIR